MLAIIIPFYKITFFEETLHSLANQSDKRFVVYIGDDNSPDDCKALSEKYSDLISINYVKFKSNLGGRSLVKQWVRCYNLIGNEEWVMFLGDDDVISNRYVEDFYKCLPDIELQSLNVIRYSSIIIDKLSNSISHHYTFPTLELSTTAYINKAKQISRASLSEHIFRRSAFDQVGFFDLPEAWHSDDLLILEISKYGTLFTINSSTAYIRYTDMSVSGQRGNCEGKNKATILFLLYLIGGKLHLFAKKERIYIIWYYFKKLKNFRLLSPNKVIEVLTLFTKVIFNSPGIVKKQVVIEAVKG